jgi:tartrate-resistant acid phosphatase type 5
MLLRSCFAATLAISSVLAGCGGSSPTLPSPRFAVIGDYGMDTPEEGEVASLVKSWKPDYVVTTGDNNYPSGERGTIDTNIGKYYAEFIGGYAGKYGPGSVTNRFWPVIGNHEYYGPEGLQPYLDYFPQLPGNQRYYEVRLGLVHLFAVNSDPREPDGVTPDSVQGQWLRDQLAASNACYKVVALHHPPFSSGEFSNPYMAWPFAEWGADVVLGGHEHFYEHLIVDGIPHLINGTGGANLFQFKAPIPESVTRFTGEHGAQLAFPSREDLRFEMHSVEGTLVETVTIPPSCPPNLPD